MAPKLYNSFPKPRICLIYKDVMVKWQQIAVDRTRENQVQHTASFTCLTLWVPQSESLSLLRPPACCSDKQEP